MGIDKKEATVIRKVIFSFLVFTLIVWAETAPKEIDFKEAKRIYNAGSGLFIDAREIKFYKKGTILGALNMPLHRFRRLKRLLPVKKSSKLILFCGGIKCGKSSELAKRIAAEGYSHVMVYRGGFPEWSQKGQEVMLSDIYCKEGHKSTSPAVTIQGVTVHLGSEEGMIDPIWFAKQFKNGTLPPALNLVDVRKASDYRQGHLPGANSIVWDADNGVIDTSKFPKDKLTLLYCNTGILSSDAYDSLDQETAKRVLFLNAVVKCKKDQCEIRPNAH